MAWLRLLRRDIQYLAPETGVFGSDWRKPELRAGLKQWTSIRTSKTRIVAAIEADQYLLINQTISQSKKKKSYCLFTCLVILHFQVWSLKLEQEVEKNKALTEALQTLATEHHELQQSLCKSRRSSTLSTLTRDDFYDAESGQQPLAVGVHPCFVCPMHVCEHVLF